MNRFTNILQGFLPHFYEIFSNSICLKLDVKSKLPPHNGSVALRQLNPFVKRDHKNFLVMYVISI